MDNFSWHKIPLVRLLIPFVAGILIAYETDVKIGNYFLLAIPAFFFVLHLAFSKGIWISYTNRWLPGLVVSLAFLTFGFFLTSTFSDSSSSDYFIRHSTDTSFYVCRIKNEPRISEKSVRIEAEIIATGYPGNFASTKGKALVIIAKDEIAQTLGYGDVFLCKGIPSLLPSPAYPGTFDYAAKMKTKDILYQLYIKKGHWTKLNRNEGNPIIKLALKARNYLTHLLKQSGLEDREYAMLAALLFGQRSELDDELTEAYSNVGVIHILAVSGMHVGLIYAILIFAFSFLRKLKKGEFYQIALVLITLWFFAGITGFSPSVLRATTMFSFVAVGKLFKRYIDNINILAAAALLLLIINPFSLYEIGFQLSFLAVLGIFIVYKPLYNAIDFNNYLLDKIWQMICVSIAAQAFVTPVSLYHFHQFPLIFLLSNLLVLPLVTLVMYAGILLLITSPLGLSSLFSFIAGWLIKIMNTIVFALDGLSFSKIDNIKFGLTELTFLYIVLISIIIFIKYKKKVYLYTTLTSIIIILAFQFADRLIQYNKDYVSFFKLGRTYITAIKTKEKMLIIYKGISSIQNLNRQLKPLMMNSRCSEVAYINSDSLSQTIFQRDKAIAINKNFIKIKDKTLVFLNNLGDTALLQEIKPNWIVLNNFVSAKEVFSLKNKTETQWIVQNYVNKSLKKGEFGSFFDKNFHVKHIDNQCYTYYLHKK